MSGRHRHPTPPTDFGRPSRWLLAAALLTGAMGSVPSAAAPAAAVPAGPAPIVAPPLRAAQRVLPTAPSPRAAGVREGLRAVAYTADLPDDRAQVAVSAAMAQLGLPYVWGGDGPTAGEAGFDCSGLTHFAYAAAGIMLPRTAHTQYYAGPGVPSGAPLHPGDLVFYGVPERVHHVGLYLGDGRMVNAPTFGKPVQVAYYRWSGDDYLGATRPAAAPDDPGLLPPLPAPVPLPVPLHTPSLVFEAPPAPLPDVLPGPDDPQPPEPDSAAAALAATAPGATVPADPLGRSAGPGAGEPAAGTGPTDVPGEQLTGAQAPDDPARRGRSTTAPAAGTGPHGEAPATAAEPLSVAPGGGPPDPAAAPGARAPDPTGRSGGAAAAPPPAIPPRPPAAGARPAAPVPAAPARPAPTPAAPSPAAPSPAAPSPAAPSPAAPPSADTPASTGPDVADRILAIILPSGRTDLPIVAPDPDGLPAAPGSLSASVVRVAPALLDGVTTGVPITVSRAGGMQQRMTVVSRAVVGAREAARFTAPLTLVAPAGGGNWTVIVVR